MTPLVGSRAGLGREPNHAGGTVRFASTVDQPWQNPNRVPLFKGQMCP
jgi:hypothetical protein